MTAAGLSNLVVEVLHNRGDDNRPDWSVGSGFFVGTRLVLTAWHNVDGPGELLVRVHGTEEHPAVVHLQGDQDLVDLALLEVSDVTVDVPPLCYGTVDQSAPAVVEQCWAVGFPQFKERVHEPKPLRLSAQVNGEIPTGENLDQPLLTLQVRRSPRPLPSSAVGESEWAGMSGAAVFSGKNVLVGVITEHHLPEGESALTVVPITALDLLPEADATNWWKLLGVDRHALVHLPGEAVGSLSPVEQQNRIQLIKRVRATWIEGVLEHSLYQAALIALDLQEQPNALANPWYLQVQETNLPPHPVPAGTPIIQVYDDADGALLLLGEPGAGKTTLLLQLAQVLLERAEHKKQEPLPVVFNLSSWAQKCRPLSEWLVEELRSKYQVPRKVGQAWIETDQVLPLLDGLDEVAQETQEDCVEAINTYHRQRLERGSVPLVVCCRSQEYLALSTRLALQQAISIQPLTNEQIEQYLQSAGGQLEALQQALQEDPLLDELAHRPLMLSIFTLAYQGAVLKDLPIAEVREIQQQHLLAAYVERMLTHRAVSKQFPRESTLQWLTFLAAQMQQHHQSALYLEYLQPDWLVDRQKRRLYQLLYVLIVGLGGGLLYGLGSGLVTGLTGDLSFGLVDGLVVGLSFGLGSGLVGWLLGSFSASPYAERLPLKPNQGIWRSVRNGLVGGLVVGLIVGLGSSLVSVLVGALVGTLTNPLVGTLTNPWFAGLIFGLAFGLIGGIGIGLFGLERQIEPQEVLTWSWRKQRSATGLLWVVGAGLLGGLITWLEGLFWRASSPPFWGLVGALVGALVGGLASGFSINQLDEYLRLKPNQGIWRSARNGLVLGLIFGLVGGLAFGVSLALSGASVVKPVTWLALYLVRGSVMGLVLGLLFFGLGAFLQHFTLRFLLWRTGCLPRNVVAFLDEAAERLLLRKVGGGYIFTHRLLLDYFAALEKKEF